MHTATLNLNMTFNIDALIELCQCKKPKRISIQRIDLIGCKKSSRSGFSRKRYDAADLKYPIIITTQLELIDGRHRFLKALDLGRTFINVVIVTYDELFSTLLQEDD